MMSGLMTNTESVCLTCVFGFYYFFYVLPHTAVPFAYGEGRWEHYSTKKQEPGPCEPETLSGAITK
jgi:hypothetical protein